MVFKSDFSFFFFLDFEPSILVKLNFISCMHRLGSNQGSDYIAIFFNLKSSLISWFVF